MTSKREQDFRSTLNIFLEREHSFLATLQQLEQECIREQKSSEMRMVAYKLILEGADMWSSLMSMREKLSLGLADDIETEPPVMGRPKIIMEISHPLITLREHDAESCGYIRKSQKGGSYHAKCPVCSGWAHPKGLRANQPDKPKRRDWTCECGNKFVSPAVGLPGDSNDEWVGMLKKVNAVTNGLPEQVKNDLCQDIVLSMMEGELSPDDIEATQNQIVARGFRNYMDRFGPRSLDAPLSAEAEATLKDIIAAMSDGTINDE